MPGANHVLRWNPFIKIQIHDCFGSFYTRRYSSILKL